MAKKIFFLSQYFKQKTTDKYVNICNNENSNNSNENESFVCELKEIY